MIIPIFQPFGSSSHQLAAQVGVMYGEKATHTGTLDPLAEGVLVVLTGEDRFKKGEFSRWRKRYRFGVAMGLSTDSHDLLGLIESVGGPDQELPSQVRGLNMTSMEKQLASWARRTVGEYNQTIPDFSARRVTGRSAFDWAKSGQPVPAKQEIVTIYDARLTGCTSISSEKLAKQAIQRISLVEGDFRQPEILEQWRSLAHGERLASEASGVATAIPKTLLQAQFEIEVSARTYIRGLVRDLGRELGLPAVTTGITRVANGPYQIIDCVCIL
jgi:tRNA pseudouridine(55) synthase